MNILKMLDIEFLSPYYVLPKTTQIPENDFPPVVLNNEFMELNHSKSRFLDKNELMTSNNEKLKNQKVRAVLKYHQPNPQKYIERHALHLLFTFFPFCDKGYPPLKGTYFDKCKNQAYWILLTEIKPQWNPLVR